MSYTLHVYFTVEKNYNKQTSFDSVKKLFSNINRVVFTIAKNIFTKEDYLKLTIDNRYHISVFFDDNTTVKTDLEFIIGKRLNCNARMRFLFAPDPQNDFDDIGVIILDYIQSLKEIIIYSTNQNKIIFNSSRYTN